MLSAQRDGRGGVAAEAAADGVGDDPEALPELVPVSGLGRRSSALGGPLEGWRVASKGLGALPRIRRGALGRGCGRGGRVVLQSPRAAAVSTRLRVLPTIR